DQPIITGSLYTGTAPPPFALPGNKTQSGILTSSSIGGNGFNELRFEDKAGVEEIYMHAQKDMDVAILNNLNQTIGNSKTETISSNRSETINGTDTLHVAGNQTVTVSSNASLNVTGTYSVSAGAVSVSGPGTYYGPTSISNTFNVAVDTTGSFNSAGTLIKNLDTTSSSAPALRVIANGSPAYGALSVSTQGPVSATNTNPIASFGNANVWVSYLDNNGNWYTSGSFYGSQFIGLSDRNAKENFTDISTSNVLEKVAALPLSRWNYKTDKSTGHIGPMAQDFYAAFHLGQDDKHIATVDEEGIALAAIQGLNQKLKAQLEERDAKINELEKRLNDLQQTVQALAAKKQTGGE
ncbi:MAG TPA: tail fiber domain-containing protein, partial [Verrucomicrobiae bacterium]|nr:tail fiber domain-containing protein [Verrucomicrobiae bacterium]